MSLNLSCLDAILKDTSSVNRIADFLNSSGFSYAKVAEIVGAQDSMELINSGLFSSLLYGANVDDSACSALATLFVFGRKLSLNTYTSVISQEIREIFERYSLVTYDKDNSLIGGQIAISEFQSFHFFSDIMFSVGMDDSPHVAFDDDVVWPVCAWTIELFGKLSENSNWTTLLDVGCGAGCIGVLANTKYAKIVGIDINPRAIKFSQINAKLNKVSNASFHIENCFEHFSEVRYDHISFAPPAGPTFGRKGGGMVAYGGDLGHELALKFLSEAVDKLMNRNGQTDLWCIFAISEKYGTIESLISDTLKNTNLKFTVEPIRQGPLYVSRTDIQNRTLPMLSHFSTDKEFFMAGLVENRIVELVPVVVRVKF